MLLLSVTGIDLKIGDQTILQDITFGMEQGEVVGLIGPNGSGKTTLLNVLSGFLSPTKGTICLEGKEITTSSPSHRASLGVGRVFQHAGIFREMTLEENVLVALEALPRHERKVLGMNLQAVVHDTLLLAGLLNEGKKKAGALSGGQMRLLELARTFKSSKKVFLLDEPTAGVSPQLTGQVADLILELKRRGKTVLIVEHDLPFISHICDRVIVLDLGKIVMSGDPKELMQSKQLQELYFGAELSA